MDEQICENCGFERELNRGLCEGCEAERIATAPLLATITALESRLAEAERERDEARDRATVLDFDREHARLRAIALDEICTAIFGPGEHTVDEVRAAVPALLTRARRIEEAAREVARGDDECHVCLKWGHCPQCTGNRETARRAKCERCELRAALDLPVVVRTCCYRCHQWSEVRARFDDDHRREWLCASCMPSPTPPQEET